MRFSRLLSTAVMVGSLALVSGCAQTPPPVSEKVQQAYDNIGTYTAPASPSGPVVAFIGDSYTFGTGAKNRLNRWSTQVSNQLGWQEANFGKGGTGYISISQQCSGPCTTYGGTIEEAKAASPSMVFVTGIRNDASLAPQDLDSAIGDFYPALRAALPDAKIVAISPIWDANQPPARIADIGDRIRESVEGVGGTYLDIGQPLQGHPEFLDPDGVHPNDAGYSAIAEAIRTSLEQAGIKA